MGKLTRKNFRLNQLFSNRILHVKKTLIASTQSAQMGIITCYIKHIAYTILKIKNICIDLYSFILTNE